MNQDELKEAIREAIVNHIPFDVPTGPDYHAVADVLDEVAQRLDFIKAYPHAFKHKSWAFHFSRNKGLRWGYVRNDDKIGWFEGRETTPLPERDLVIKDAEEVYGHSADLLPPPS